MCVCVCPRAGTTWLVIRLGPLVFFSLAQLAFEKCEMYRTPDRAECLSPVYSVCQSHMQYEWLACIAHAPWMVSPFLRYHRTVYPSFLPYAGPAAICSALAAVPATASHSLTAISAATFICHSPIPPFYSTFAVAYNTHSTTEYERASLSRVSEMIETIH